MNINKLLAREQAFDVKYYKTGIGRRKIKKKVFIYFYIINKKLVSKQDQVRINKLHIPPAWINVWISPDPKSPIQAIGIDSKGIKQYRYNEIHIKKAEEKKFIKMYDFIKKIPKLDKVIKKHEKLDTYDKYRVIASMLTIIKLLHLRVGKEVYARRNKSYGVSSLRKVHMNIEGDIIRLRFKGKSKKRLSYSLKNKILAKHLRLLLRLEGSKLFQYIDDVTGKVKGITDVDLNNYVQSIMGKKFTIKDFRTYSSNRYFIMALLKETQKRAPKNTKVIKKNIINAIKRTAKYLRHTKAVSKKSYILNFIVNMYQNNPEYFLNAVKKESDPNDILLNILRLYKKKVINI
uniref:DNA topoisomerase n=1 Tax=Mimivirus LCMiAC02 TaxID=2506609 RepID=A0A481Z2Y5_9VIRU|nr:MAG: DNA topoisomerase I [Mimivirus LCMiAC02]